MQHVAVVRDGRLTLYAADGADLVEYGRILVPAEFSAEAAAALGLNIAAVTGLGDGGSPAPVAADLPKALPAGARAVAGKSRTERATFNRVVREVEAQPGITVTMLMAILGWQRKAVSNALQAGARHGMIQSAGFGKGWYPIKRV